MAKIKTKDIFRRLKETLLRSGYEVILTNKLGRTNLVSAVRFRRTKGYIAPDQLRIYINQGIGVNDRVITLVHELLHEIYPEWTEPQVERESKSVFKDLTVPQLGFLQFFVMTKPELRVALKGHKSNSPIC